MACFFTICRFVCWLVVLLLWFCFLHCSLLNTDVTSDAKKGNNIFWWNIIYCRFIKYKFFDYIATLFNNSCCDGMTIKDTHLVSTKSLLFLVVGTKDYVYTYTHIHPEDNNVQQKFFKCFLHCKQKLSWKYRIHIHYFIFMQLKLGLWCHLDDNFIH